MSKIKPKELKHGLRLTLKNGDDERMEIYKTFEMREPTAGDVIDASEESEKLVTVKDGFEFVSSPALMGFHMLRRQIKKIGDISGPISVKNMRKLHPEDLEILQVAAENIDSATAGAIASRGRSEQTQNAD